MGLSIRSHNAKGLAPAQLNAFGDRGARLWDT